MNLEKLGSVQRSRPTIQNPNFKPMDELQKFVILFIGKVYTISG